MDLEKTYILSNVINKLEEIQKDNKRNSNYSRALKITKRR